MVLQSRDREGVGCCPYPLFGWPVPLLSFLPCVYPKAVPDGRLSRSKHSNAKREERYMRFINTKIARMMQLSAFGIVSLVLPTVLHAQVIDLIETDSGSGDVLTTNNPLAVITQNAADDWSINLSAL